MAGRMRISQSGIDLITRFEGFRARSAALEDGGHIIGYGHTRHAKANQRITEDDARTLLIGHDLKPIERAITARSLAPVSQNEFDALVAFAFNIGLENFLDSDVWAMVNSGAKLRAAEAMAAWRKARVDGRVIVVDALVRRRAAERALFLEVPGGPTPVPSPIIKPQLDLARAIMAPREASYDVTAGDGEDDTVIRVGIVGSDPAPEPGPGPAPDMSAESAPEAAARAVTARLTRILGEDTQSPQPAVESEPSVAEITRAVSALADPLDEMPVPSEPTAKPAAREPAATQDKTPESTPDEDGSYIVFGTQPPGEVPGTDEDLLDFDVDAPSANAAPATLVDDLEEITAEVGNAPVEAVGGSPTPWGSLLLYGLASASGALIGAWGVKHLSEAMSTDIVLQSDWDLYAGPFAILVGGLIFLIMAYYLMRALFAEK